MTTTRRRPGPVAVAKSRRHRPRPVLAVREEQSMESSRVAPLIRFSQRTSALVPSVPLRPGRVRRSTSCSATALPSAMSRGRTGSQRVVVVASNDAFRGLFPPNVMPSTSPKSAARGAREGAQQMPYESGGSGPLGSGAQPNAEAEADEDAHAILWRLSSLDSGTDQRHTVRFASPRWVSSAAGRELARWGGVQRCSSCPPLPHPPRSCAGRY